MSQIFLRVPRQKARSLAGLAVLCCFLLPLVVTPQRAVAALTAGDDFNRANGRLGPNWTGMSDAGLAIFSDQVRGTNGGGDSGDIRTAETYSSDQYSQVSLTSTQLTGTQWIGPAVRAQGGGMTAYVGFYFWNNGSPALMLFERDHGRWTQLGPTVRTGPLPAGTQLALTAVGNTVSFAENGSQVIGVTSSALTGGAPGIIANGHAPADDWAGGSFTAASGFQATYRSTTNGIATWNMISASNGYGPQKIRVLAPANPAPGVAHNFLIVLPVEAGLGSTYGDALRVLHRLNATNQYNLTIVEPTFAMAPWDANNATDPNLQYETFFTNELVPWIQQNLATTGHEQTWLLGFSKSGLGAQDLILKHPKLFTLAASWDFPADISSYTQYGDSAGAYGTDANFQASYRLTASFVSAHAGPFQASNRIWTGGYSLYQQDVSDYDALLASAGIRHSAEAPQEMAHRWDSGWVPLALSALSRDSLDVPPGS